MIAQIIGAMIVLGIGIFVLVPMIQQGIQVFQNKTQIDSSTYAGTILSIVPVLFALMIIASAVAICYNGLANAGLISEGNERGYDENYDKLEPEEKHKQTYKQYVKERLAIEKMMKR